MKRLTVGAGIVVGLLLSVAWIHAVGFNIAVDAVTRATLGYNRFDGSLSFLTDGLTPDNSDEARLFAWPSKGNLVFTFATPRAIDGVRLRVGADAGSYAVLAYLGAAYGETGQTETMADALVADVYDFDYAPDTWVDLPFPPGTVTDYIALVTESGAEFYEVEILSSEPSTAVMAISWGQVKNGIR
ncbi:MAG: hypothetical protein O2782_13160 [bacterium]|nr:hypothetical protein [bacterium]